VIDGEEGSEFTSYSTEEFSHGRLEKRKIFTTDHIDFLPQKSKWTGLSQIVCVQSSRTYKEKTSEENRYYISSLNVSPEILAGYIRSHWSIENQCHWVLDVAFREDRQRAKAGHIPENISIMRRISQNYLKQDSTVKAGLEIKRQKAGWDHDYLLQVLGVKSF
jgi:predicted transposase YbfD/YdcC